MAQDACRRRMTWLCHTLLAILLRLQIDNILTAKLLMDEVQAGKFSNMDLVVVDKTNPLDEDNEKALFDHAIAQCEGKGGTNTLRLRFCLDEAAQAGHAAAAARVGRMRKQLLVPMTGWCGRGPVLSHEVSAYDVNSFNQTQRCGSKCTNPVPRWPCTQCIVLQ
jgi:hypothetical protein